jgi:hypothetical protein
MDLSCTNPWHLAVQLDSPEGRRHNSLGFENVLRHNSKKVFLLDNFRIDGRFSPHPDDRATFER